MDSPGNLLDVQGHPGSLHSFQKSLIVASCCWVSLFTCESSEVYQQGCGVRNLLLIGPCSRLDIFPHEMSISLDPPAQYQSSAVEDCAILDYQGVYTQVCVHDKQ